MAVSFDHTCVDKIEKRCCGIPVVIYAYAIAVFELLISVAGIWYSWYGTSHYEDYNSEIVYHDVLYLEARNHYSEDEMTSVPVDWIQVDMYFFMAELLAAVLLMNGVTARNIGSVRIWLSIMLAYTLLASGLYLGFIIGGIQSTYLAVFGTIHAAIRFYEIGVVYGFYELLEMCESWRENTQTRKGSLAPPFFMDAIVQKV